MRSLDAGALHPSFSKFRYIIMLRLRLYLDDSGSHATSPVFVMGGWVSSEKQWSRFEREWQRALDEAGIDVFHATNFFGRKGKCNTKGDRYEDWSKEKHEKFAKRFTAIAENPKHTIAGIGRGIDMSAYRDLVLPNPVFRVGTPHNRFWDYAGVKKCNKMLVLWTTSAL